MSVALALFAMLIELCVGYPERVLRMIGHPVTWIGAMIGLFDRLLNPFPRPLAGNDKGEGWRRGAGIVTILIVLGIVGAVALFVQHELLRLPFGIFVAAILASTLIAQRSLYQHVANVAV